MANSEIIGAGQDTAHRVPKINTITCGDCLEVMQSIPDKSIDMILCDLPYGTTQNEWDNRIDMKELWRQYLRVCVGAIVLTSAEPYTSELVVGNKSLFKYCWYWDKIRAKNHLNAKRQPMRAIEPICVFYKNQPTYNPILTEKRKQDIRDNGRLYQYKNNGNYGKTNLSGFLNEHRKIPVDLKYPDDLITINGVGSFGFEKTGHPTQKPVALFEYLIRTYTNEGDTVLDNCIGSGTTAIACINTGRNFIGIEKEEKYCRIAEERIHALIRPAQDTKEICHTAPNTAMAKCQQVELGL